MKPQPVADWLAATDAQADAAAPRYRRLYEALRGAVLEHRLPAGARLPSTRALAEELGVSRNTVAAAFDQLLAEGYIESRVGSGSFVADLGAAPAPRQNTVVAGRRQGLAERGRRLLAQDVGAAQEILPFVAGIDDYAPFPAKLWQRLANRYWREGRTDLFEFAHGGGHLPLRRAIARHIGVARGARVDAEQILVTAGTQHSIALCAQVLANAGDIAWVEDPGYWAARKALAAADLRLRPVRVDAQGRAPQRADRSARPRLIYVTPSHQYPTSAVMSLARRRQLLDYAAASGAWILEDDYDSEFRYRGRPLGSLQGLDAHGCVIYLGTFSKSLYPGIKLAYMAVPPAIAADFRAALYDLQRPGQLMLQATLADFIEQGHYATHVRRVRQVWGERRDILARTLRPLLGRAATLTREESGLHLLIELPAGANDVALAALVAGEGMTVRPLSSYYLGEARRKGLLVGYAYVPTHEIARHARRLGEVVKRGLRSYG